LTIYLLRVHSTVITPRQTLILNGVVLTNYIIELARSADVILSRLTEDEVVQNRLCGSCVGLRGRAAGNRCALDEHDLSRKLTELHNQTGFLHVHP
jgi:hypothetical protein